MKKSALYFAILVVMLDSIGFGLLIPVLPSLLTELGNTDISGAAGISLWLTASYAMMQFLFGPLLGVLSDRFGRKPVLVTSVAALGIDYIILAMAPALWVLFVGRLIAGVAGATFSTAFAVAADVSKPEERGANIGMVSAGFGLGFVLGPMLGGLIGEAFGPRGPIWAAAMISAVNFAFGLFIFRETNKAENRRAIDLAKTNPFTALFALRHAGPALVFVLGYFVFTLVSNVYQTIWPFFSIERFGWSESMVGLSLGAVGIGFFISQGVLLGPLLKRYGPERVLMGSVLIATISLAVLMIIESGILAFLFMPFMALGALATPTLNSLISTRMPADQQGSIQGLLASMMGLALVIGPFLYNGSFQFFTAEGTAFYWPGAPFVIALVLCCLTLIPAWMALRSRNNKAEGQSL